MRQFWLHQSLIVLVAAVVLLTNLGGTRLWDRDEPRNAGCAAEMLAGGDWVVPVFNAELRAHKPILLYWLMMTAYAVFGVTEFAARLPSALLAIGTALATYQIGRKLFQPQVGLWAAVILVTALMFDVAGRAATPDSCLIFFSTLALMIYVLTGWDRQQGYFPTSWLAVLAMYGSMGMAVLAKGPVGLVLPTAVIGMFLLIVRLPEGPPAASLGWRLRLASLLRPFAPRHFLRTVWFMRPLTALLAAGAVALPWYVWVGLRTDGEFLRVFFLEHNVARAAGAMEGHGGSVLYYPLAILIGFFPWSVFAAPVLINTTLRTTRRDPHFAGYVFAACWIGVYVGLFSLAQTKLPSYVTPCYPALAVLTADLLARWIDGDSLVPAIWMKLSLVALAVVGLAMAIGLPVASARLLPGEAWLGAIGAIPLAGAAVGLWLIHQQRRRQAVWAVSLTAVVFVTSVFGLVLPRVDRHQQNHVLLSAIERAGGVPQIGSYECLEPSWIFYGGRPIHELVLKPAATEPAPGAARGGQHWQTRPRGVAKQFFANGHDRFIITTDRAWEQLREQLPPEAAIVAECPRFLKKGRLLLIGRSGNDVQTAERPHIAGGMHR